MDRQTADVFAPFADEIDQQTTRAVANLLSVVPHGRLTTIEEGSVQDVLRNVWEHMST